MASVDVFDVETKEVSWNTRKGHRHLLLGSGKGRSSFSHSVSSKWLRRQQPRPETLTMELQGSSESKGRKQAMPRRYAEESEHCMVKSAREALEWQSHESCELWWWHFGNWAVHRWKQRFHGLLFGLGERVERVESGALGESPGVGGGRGAEVEDDYAVRAPKRPKRREGTGDSRGGRVRGG